MSEKVNLVAKIQEHTCIGCTKCIDVCPVDAIIGAPKQLHVVLEDLCIGCKLCIPPCPVDCITIENIGSLQQEERLQRAAIAKVRHQARKARLLRKEQIKEEKDKQVISNDIKALIAASIARSKQKYEQN